PGVALATQIGASHRLHEQKVAGQRQRLVGDERRAAQGVSWDVSGDDRRASERDRVPFGKRLVRESAFGAVVRGTCVVGVHEVGDLPAGGGSAGTAQVVGVHVRVDYRRGGGPEVLEQRLVL